MRRPAGYNPAMRALRIETFGDLDRLSVRDLPPPTPGDGEALVRVEAAGLNPSDVGNASGRFGQTTLPRTPGRDYAGIIEQGPAEWIGKLV